METPAAEGVEGRPVTQENAMEPNIRPAQDGKRMSQGLHGVRERARSSGPILFPQTHSLFRTKTQSHRYRIWLARRSVTVQIWREPVSKLKIQKSV